MKLQRFASFTKMTLIPIFFKHSFKFSRHILINSRIIPCLRQLIFVTGSEKRGHFGAKFFFYFFWLNTKYIFFLQYELQLTIQITVTTTIEPLDTSPVRNSFSWKSTLKFNVYSPRND